MIYLDHAATTPLKPEVFSAMQPYLREEYGNPSGIYQFSAETKKKVEQARKRIADTLQAKPEEIYFTSGGTEARSQSEERKRKTHRYDKDRTPRRFAFL